MVQPGLARQIVDLKTASSNLVGPAINFSLIPGRERFEALIDPVNQSFLFVFTFQRARASFPDDGVSFSHYPLLAFKIFPNQAR